MKPYASQGKKKGLMCEYNPVGAVLARDKGTANIRSIASSLIAGKHRSHRGIDPSGHP